MGVFPDTPFFLKSQQTGLFVSVEAAEISNAGARLTLEKQHSKGYERQLWEYDTATGRIKNKQSGFVLSAEALKENAYICQATVVEGSELQEWGLTTDYELCLKHDNSWVLGLKDSWFSVSREGSHIYLQKSKGPGQNEHQKFSILLPLPTKSTVSENNQQGTFPDGWFFMKNQANGTILTVSETSHSSTEIVAAKLDTSNYSRQLWRYKDGFLISKASGKVLDVRGGKTKK